MKKIFLIAVVLPLFFVNTFAQDNNFQKLGLVSQLTEIKYNSEAYFLNSLEKDPAEAEKKGSLKNYSTIRMQIDRIIYQLAADMRSKNSPRLFRQLNNYYKLHDLTENTGAKKQIQPYVAALSDVALLFRSRISPPPDNKTFIPLETIIAQGWTALADLNEMRGQRVDGILNVLDNLRLASPYKLANIP